MRELLRTLGAHVAPHVTDSYDDQEYVKCLASLYSGTAGNALETLQPKVLTALEGLLAVNDAPLVDFANSFGGGDIERLRVILQDMVAGCGSSDDLERAIADFNREVRHYASRADRLLRVDILAFIANLVALAMGTSVPAEATIGMILSKGWLTSLTEDRAATNATVGRALDSLNAKLAGVRTDVVPVCRMKKQLSSLK
jgi:hypothetical protein